MPRLVDKPGIREYEQGQTDMFINEICEKLQKKKQQDTMDRCPRAERTTGVVETEEREPCSVKLMHNVSDEKGGSQTMDTHHLELENDETCCLHKEKISKHGTTHATSPQVSERGDEPVSPVPMCSKTRNEFLSGPQTAKTFHQLCSIPE
jgi:hypothetical protein